jgi:hypothetical protein
MVLLQERVQTGQANGPDLALERARVRVSVQLRQLLVALEWALQVLALRACVGRRVLLLPPKRCACVLPLRRAARSALTQSQVT